MILNMGLYEPIYGAYTELFAGLSPDVTPEKTGSWSK
jgi:retinol dehydrogenase 12